MQLARHTKGCVHDVVLLLERLAVGGFPKMGHFPFLLSVSYAPKFHFCSLEAFSLKLLGLLSARDAFSCRVTTSGTRNREIGWQVTNHITAAFVTCWVALPTASTLLTYLVQSDLSSVMDLVVLRWVSPKIPSQT